MHRDFEVPIDADEYGNVLNADDINNAYAFVDQTLRLFGGAFTIAAVRDEISAGQFQMRSLFFRYDSFVPANRVTPEGAESVGDPVANGA